MATDLKMLAETLRSLRGRHAALLAEVKPHEREVARIAAELTAVEAESRVIETRALHADGQPLDGSVRLHLDVGEWRKPDGTPLGNGRAAAPPPLFTDERPGTSPPEPAT